MRNYPKPRLLAHSTSWLNIPIASFEVWWPTWKLAELRTHRKVYQIDDAVISSAGNDTSISMNANSSRAIPFDLQAQMAQENPFMPIWTKNKPGMQGEPLGQNQDLDNTWRWQFGQAKYAAESMAQEWGLHKQDLSALIQPWSWTICVLTADLPSWKSFFELRCHEAVYPAVRVICEEMKALLGASSPKFLKVGEWHCAYDPNPFTSASKCARISFNNQEKQEAYEAHKARAQKLFAQKHFSIAEHQYKVPSLKEVQIDFNYSFEHDDWGNNPRFARGKYLSNVQGWIQLRKMLEAGEEIDF